MSAVTSLIPGLDEIVKSGDPKHRAEAARRISELFLQGAAHFRPDHVDLFDGLLIDLVPIPRLPHAQVSPSGCRFSPMPPASWSGNWRAKTRYRSPVRCCAAHPFSMNRR